MSLSLFYGKFLLCMHFGIHTTYAVKDIVKVYGLLRMLVMKHNNNKNYITCKNLTKYKPTNEQ